MAQAALATLLGFVGAAALRHGRRAAPPYSCTEWPCEYQCAPEGCSFSLTCVDNVGCSSNTPECTLQNSPHCEPNVDCDESIQQIRAIDDIEPGCYHKHVCCVSQCKSPSDYHCLDSCFRQSCMWGSAEVPAGARALPTWGRPTIPELDAGPSGRGLWGLSRNLLTVRSGGRPGGGGSQKR